MKKIVESNSNQYLKKWLSTAILSLLSALFLVYPVSATSQVTTNAQDTFNSPFPVAITASPPPQYNQCPIGHGQYTPCYKQLNGLWRCWDPISQTWRFCAGFTPPPSSCPGTPTYSQTLIFANAAVVSLVGYHVLQVSWTYCGQWDLPSGAFTWVIAKNSLGQTIYLNNGADTIGFSTGTCNGSPCWQFYYGNIVYSYWVIDNLCYSGQHVSNVDHLNLFANDVNGAPISVAGNYPGSSLPGIC